MATIRLAPVRFACELPGTRFPRVPLHRPPARRKLLFRPVPDPRYGLSLARFDCASRRLRPGVKAPGLQLPTHNLRLPGPFGFLAPLPRPVCPDLGGFFASCPLPVPRSLLPALPKTFTPLRGFYPPRDQRSISVRPIGPPAEPARYQLSCINNTYTMYSFFHKIRQNIATDNKVDLEFDRFRHLLQWLFLLQSNV